MLYQIVSKTAKRVISGADTGTGRPSRYIWSDEGTNYTCQFQYSAAKSLVSSMLNYARSENLPEGAPEWDARIELWETVVRNGNPHNNSRVIDVGAYSK